MSETPEKFDRTESHNNAFVQFATEQAQSIVNNHGGVMAAVLVAMDGNGYISIASFALAPQGVSILLEQARELNANKTPSIEKHMAMGETLNELEQAEPAAAGPALEADAAEPAAGTADGAPTQH